ncbi:MAG: tetratricopeptide repeat protein, partial [Chloroflexales bacterium]|nr:tetratricopeptide repeat protein [Chloroflexales bacterium]
MSDRPDNPSPADLTQALHELLASDASPQEFTRRLFEINVAQARASDPLLAELMPTCAIPSSFDAAIIGVLRDAPADAATNARLLEQLAVFNYVQPYEDGSYAYHDTVREMLLEQWQADNRREEYAQIKQRLAGYYFERGKQQHREEDYTAALSSLNEALRLHDDIRFYRWRGIVYVELEQSEEAIQDLDRVLAVYPDDGLAIGERGCAYYQLKQYAEALQDLSQAIALPHDPERGMSEERHYALYYHWRGRAYYQAQAYAAARADFTQAIALLPEDGDNYWGRGRVAYAQQNYAAALADFTQAITLQPEDGYNYYWRGRVQYDAQDYTAALDDFAKAIELQPEDGNNYRGRGRAHYAQQDYAAARADFTQAIALRPEDGN